MNAVIMISRNEIDIIELSLRHLLAEGIDHIWITDASDDGTRDVIENLVTETAQITVLSQIELFINQPAVTNHLAYLAGEAGAAWILPCDVDELPYSCAGVTLADTLNESEAMVLGMRVYQHSDRLTRFVHPHVAAKMACRYSHGIRFEWGNHALWHPSGAAPQFDILAMRELKYRGYQHFLDKVHQRTVVLSPEDKAAGIGAHHTRMESWSEDQKRAEWETIMGVEVVQDPIPSHLPDDLMEALFPKY